MGTGLASSDHLAGPFRQADGWFRRIFGETQRFERVVELFQVALQGRVLQQFRFEAMTLVGFERFEQITQQLLTHRLIRLHHGSLHGSSLQAASRDLRVAR